jgi:hypothetical protein
MRTRIELLPTQAGRCQKQGWSNGKSSQTMESLLGQLGLDFSLSVL